MSDEVTTVRVVVADDQTVVREGLVTMLDLVPDIEVLGAAADGAAAIALVQRCAPDVVLMDLHMPGIDGTEATARLRAEHPGVRVVVLTTYADEESILGALRAGALGYLTKDAGRAQITRAVHAAATGQAVLDPDVQARLLAAATPPPQPGPVAAPDGLTHREVEILGLIAQGLSNREIGCALFIGMATVKTHINHLLAKTAQRDRAQLVSYAYRHHLAPP
ncbi:response regulator transcription factor [Saccharopolyspora sp. NPDC047091]|uniref:response regulator transcription factor n=1 Tax=Saccharopolyspora sp. NPDC047091 TaxID=3155924 RepID=UPI0033C18178